MLAAHLRDVQVYHFSYPTHTRPVVYDAYPYLYPTCAEDFYPRTRATGIPVPVAYPYLGLLGKGIIGL